MINVKANTLTVTDPLLNRLMVDRYGILFEVLLKEEIVNELEDFVERVE